LTAERRAQVALPIDGVGGAVVLEDVEFVALDVEDPSAQRSS
jgi:hypothetical protein